MGPPSGPFSYRESEFLYDPRGIGFMELISGNEAIARGAWEADATIGVAYPGTPSTETMETFAKQPGVYAEWRRAGSNCLAAPRLSSR